MEFWNNSISFERGGRARSPNAPHTKDVVYLFPGKLTQLTAVLTGADFGFSPFGDRNLGMVEIKIDTTFVREDAVRVTATLFVTDWSGDWDQPFEGTIYFVLLYEIIYNP